MRARREIQTEALLKPLKVGLLSAYITRSGGGVFESLLTLAKSLQATSEITPIVFGLSDEHLVKELVRYDEIGVCAFPRSGPRSFGFSHELYRAVLKSEVDVLHLHGIWMFPSIVGGAWAKHTGKPYIISPHGMLDKWIISRNKWKKDIARLVYENRNFSRAQILHALNVPEEEAIRSAFVDKSVVNIPNGVDLNSNKHSVVEFAARRPHIVFLSRLHEKKNVEGLLDAWFMIKDLVQERNYRLIIAGYGEPEYVERLRRKVLSISPQAPVEFVGAVFGEKKSELLTEARYLILPSYSEGLPMTVLEAWGSGTPALITPFCNLSQGIARGAAIEIGTSPEAIALGLTTALCETAEQWNSRAKEAKRVVETDFSSKIVARRWVALYRSLVYGDGRADVGTVGL